jgi:enoyl-CoA hydratase/carnithine racemase
MPEGSKYETILYERRGRIALITLNRPDKLNAWSARMEGEFLDALDQASADPDVHVIVVTGAGRAFCAGGDISAWFGDLSARAQGEGEGGSPEVPM